MFAAEILAQIGDLKVKGPVYSVLDFHDVKEAFATLDRAAVMIQRMIYELSTANCTIEPRPRDAKPDIDAIVRDLGLVGDELEKATARVHNGNLLRVATQNLYLTGEATASPEGRLRFYSSMGAGTESRRLIVLIEASAVMLFMKEGYTRWKRAASFLVRSFFGQFSPLRDKQIELYLAIRFGALSRYP